MALRQLMAVTDHENAKYRPWINTGGPMDIITGKFVPGVDGNDVLSGGLGFTTAIIAEANRFKSTLLNSCAINAMARWPGSLFLVNDTEYSALDARRLASMSDLYVDEPDRRAAHIADLMDRIHLYDPTTKEAESLDAWMDHLKTIRDEKVKHHKDYTVETELLDPETGKPYLMTIPTFASIDSLSEAMVKQINMKNEEFDASTEMKEQRTMHMEEGWQKSRMLRQITSICAKGGINLLLTGHMGKKIAVGNTPNKKDMAYMGQDEKVTGMSSKTYYLMSSMAKITNTEPVLNAADRKLTDYPSEEHVANNELQRLLIMLVRCKNAPSGTMMSMISSQRQGILNALSYYDNLRAAKYYGLGAAGKVRNPFLGDLNIGRTRIFDESKNYKVKRALEITYSLFMIQSTWSLFDQPVDYSISIEKLVEELAKSPIAADDILNSRGYWTYKDAKPDRPYLSLPDIIRIANGTYKPKLFAVTSGK